MKNLSLLVLMSISATAQATEVTEVNLNVSYGALSKTLAEAMDQAINKVVRTADCSNVKPNEYKCGEVKAGQIKNASEKVLMDFHISSMKGKEDGVHYDLSAKDISIYLSRKQSAASWQVADLDSRQVAKMNTSSRFGENVLAAFDPRGGKLNNVFCANIPGMHAYSDQIEMKGKIKKEIWLLPDLHAKLTVKVDAGQIKFDNAKICSEIQTVMDAKGLPKISLVRIGDPKFYDMNHDGIKVKVDADLNGFWGFINSITKAFGFNIEKEIAEAVQKVAQKQASKRVNIELADVKSGKWLAKYIDGVHLNKQLEKVSNEIRANLLAKGWGKSPIEDALANICLDEAKRANLSARDLAKFVRICKMAPKLKANFFVNDTGYRNAGCYSNYFDPHATAANGRDKWWKEGCQIVSNVKFETPNGMGEPILCFVKFANDHTVSPRCKSVVKVFIADVLAGRYGQ